jgi:hypothetical protein
MGSALRGSARLTWGIVNRRQSQIFHVRSFRELFLSSETILLDLENVPNWIANCPIRLQIPRAGPWQYLVFGPVNGFAIFPADERQAVAD